MGIRSSVLIAVLSLLPGCGGTTELSQSAAPVAPGYCAKACSVTADCCPSGDLSCPGDYPHNYSCEGGLCRAPHCEDDQDCSLVFGGNGVDKLVCRTRAGHRGCMWACSEDADCKSLGGLSGGVCSGKADDGTRICGLPAGTSTLGCKADTDCPAGRHCQSGVCGCENDAECGPNLDICTKNPDFSYPPSAAPGMGGG